MTDLYEFKGKHYFGSLKDCQTGITEDRTWIWEQLTRAISKSGATVVGYGDHIFPGGGLTCFFVLSESHCSIHTYPEKKSLFVDFFTCGDTCDPLSFHQEICKIFQPENVNFNILDRY